MLDARPARRYLPRVIANVRLLPRRIRTAARFRAPDPWSGGVITGFSIEAYALVPERITAPEAWPLYAVGARLLHGLRSDADGAERMLPASLVALWQGGDAPAEALPGLLHALGGDVSRRDTLPASRWPAVPAIVLCLALAVAGVALLPAALARQRQQIQRPRTVTEQAWLAEAPVPGESLAIAASVPLVGRVPLPGRFRLPDGVAGPASSGLALGWVRDVRGHRAILVSARPPGLSPQEREVMQRLARLGAARSAERVAPGASLVLASAELGLDGALRELAPRAPGLDLATVTCPGFARKRTGWDAASGLVLVLAAAAAFLGVAFALVLALVVLPRERRRERQMARARALLAGASA